MYRKANKRPPSVQFARDIFDPVNDSPAVPPACVDFARRSNAPSICFQYLFLALLFPKFYILEFLPKRCFGASTEVAAVSWGLLIAHVHDHDMSARRGIRRERGGVRQVGRVRGRNRGLGPGMCTLSTQLWALSQREGQEGMWCYQQTQGVCSIW